MEGEHRLRIPWRYLKLLGINASYLISSKEETVVCWVQIDKVRGMRIVILRNVRT